MKIEMSEEIERKYKENLFDDIRRRSNNVALLMVLFGEVHGSLFAVSLQWVFYFRVQNKRAYTAL